MESENTRLSSEVIKLAGHRNTSQRISHLKNLKIECDELRAKNKSLEIQLQKFIEQENSSGMQTRRMSRKKSERKVLSPIQVNENETNEEGRNEKKIENFISKEQFYQILKRNEKKLQRFVCC